MTILGGGGDWKGALGDVCGGLVTSSFLICMLACWLCSLREYALSCVPTMCALLCGCSFTNTRRLLNK